MKKRYKIIILWLTLLLMLNFNTFAENIELPKNVELIGDASGIIFFPDDDMFLIAKNMLPGDKISRTMIIKNNYESSYKLFIKAERITKKEEYDLLDKILLIIKYKDEIIYKGRISGEDGMLKNIKLGTVMPGEKIELDASVYLDGETTGNEYKNKNGEIKWIFTAIKSELAYPEEEEEEPEKPKPEKPKPEEPKTVEVNPEKPKNPNLPQTGTPILLLVSDIVLSVILIISGSLLIFKKKNK